MLLMKKPATIDYIMATANEELVCESKYQFFINTRKYEEPGSSVSDHRVCGNVCQPAYGEESLHDVHNPEGGTVIPIVEHKGSVKLGLFLDQCFKFGNFETGQEDSPIYDKRQCNTDFASPVVFGRNRQINTGINSEEDAEGKSKFIFTQVLIQKSIIYLAGYSQQLAEPARLNRKISYMHAYVCMHH